MCADMDSLSKSEYIISLAKEIIDNIELSNCEPQAILLKTTRLAREKDNEEIRKWLKFEMQGYRSDDEVAIKYMSKTGRWTNRKENKGYWMPFAQIEATIVASKDKLKLYRIPDTDKTIIVNGIKNAIMGTYSEMSALEGVKSRVISLLHNFATTVYNEKVFDNLAESIFDSYKKEVDLLLAENTGDILNRIPYVIERLNENDTEAISQALLTCRRIIDSFADKILPARQESIIVEGKTISLKQDKVINRIVTYISENCSSKSRMKKLKDNLENLYDRVSTGVHNDIDRKEAKSLFFNTYLLLGEILTLRNN